MPDMMSLIAFAGIALGMVLTPGPNMVYLISRTISQGRVAGLISLGGVVLGFVFYMLCAALGITAIVMAVPYAYDTLRIAGAVYLLYLAWQAVQPKGKSIFKVKDLPRDSSLKLFIMGFLTNLLNPKIAVMYLSLLPQFITVDHGSIFGQSLVLGFVQIMISLAVNMLIILSASTIAVSLQQRPIWINIQRWFMGTVLFGLAIRMMTTTR